MQTLEEYLKANKNKKFEYVFCQSRMTGSELLKEDVFLDEKISIEDNIIHIFNQPHLEIITNNYYRDEHGVLIDKRGE